MRASVHVQGCGCYVFVAQPPHSMGVKGTIGWGIIPSTRSRSGPKVSGRAASYARFGAVLRRVHVDVELGVQCAWMVLSAWLPSLISANIRCALLKKKKKKKKLQDDLLRNCIAT